MDQKIIRNVIEAAMFAAGRPMSLNELLRLFSEDERPERKLMKELLDELRKEYDERGIELVEVASGYRIQVRHHMGEWLGRLSERKAPRYSRALMETLALIAYRQPITRGDIEDVRGVSVSTNIIRTLLERGWVRIVGHRDVPGRPAMFGTSKDFLDYFNLKSLDELPSLSELKDIDSMNTELDFGTPPYEDGEDIDDLQTADGGDTRAEFEEEFGEDLELSAEDSDDKDELDENVQERVEDDQEDFDDEDQEYSEDDGEDFDDEDQESSEDDGEDFDGEDQGYSENDGEDFDDEDQEYSEDDRKDLEDDVQESGENEQEAVSEDHQEDAQDDHQDDVEVDVDNDDQGVEQAVSEDGREPLGSNGEDHDDTQALQDDDTVSDNEISEHGDQEGQLDKEGAKSDEFEDDELDSLDDFDDQEHAADTDTDADESTEPKTVNA